METGQKHQLDKSLNADFTSLFESISPEALDHENFLALQKPRQQG